MKVKLTPLKPEHKNKYVVVADFMHGDADAYSTEEYVCKDEADFIRVMSRVNDIPPDPGSCGDEEIYDSWCAETFSDDFVPGDCTCDHQFKACLQDYEGFYYDEAGIKFKARLEP